MSGRPRSGGGSRRRWGTVIAASVVAVLVFPGVAAATPAARSLPPLPIVCRLVVLPPLLMPCEKHDPPAPPPSEPPSEPPPTTDPPPTSTPASEPLPAAAAPQALEPLGRTGNPAEPDTAEPPDAAAPAATAAPSPRARPERPTVVAEPDPTSPSEEVAKQRRWAVTVLAVVLGAGAVAAAMKRRTH
jgi:hypothetical protein